MSTLRPASLSRKREHTVLVALPSEIVTKDGVSTVSHPDADAQYLLVPIESDTIAFNHHQRAGPLLNVDNTSR
jgi:hypothetical protein